MGLKINTEGPMGVCTPHMQSKDTSLPLRTRVANSVGHGYRARFECYGFCCTLERITLSALIGKTRLVYMTC